MVGKAETGWFVRKIVYAVVALIMAGLVAFGVVSEGTSETITAQLTPLLGAIALAFASGKTHRGSDSTATDEDVQKAAEAVPEPAPPVETVSAEEIASVLADRFGLGEDTGRHHIDEAPEDTYPGLVE